MELLYVALVGLGLSMDVFALSAVTGMTMKRLNIKHSVMLALLFGAFHIIMPIIGWSVGSYIENYIASFDHWVAAGMLCYIGGKMMKESFDDESEKINILDKKKLLIIGFLTSIDAFFIGISFALIDTIIFSPALLIGTIAAIMCLIGIYAGKKTGKLLGKRAELFGGIVLIIIGLKILLEHLF